ncbi:MAG: hypothetical protein ACYC9Z_05500 [Casimicrobiaceae bacterium]
MKITAQISMWGSVVFALVCLYVGFSGLSQLDAIASWWLARRDDAAPR